MIKRLCKDIEIALNKKIETPKDFELLKERIYAQQNIYVSRTTLMRVWGYINENVTPRVKTLNILAKFLGYHDLNDYHQNAMLPKNQQSNPVMNRRLSTTSLNRGECLRLTWQPERVCDIKYLGNITFEVVESKNTRLSIGDTFQCSLIIEGEPLYLDNLKQGTNPPIAYVCGKKNGVLFEYLKQSE